MSGRAALLSGRVEVALRYFQQAAEADPNYIADFTPLRQGVWTYVGRSYYALGKLPEARQALTQALSRNDRDPMGRLYLGLTLLREEKDKKNDKAFSFEEILYALKERVSPKRVAQLVRERGINFEPTVERIKELKRWEADDSLVDQIKKTGADYIKRAGEALSGERGFKEVEKAMKDLHAWLEGMSVKNPSGQFWDPRGQIRSHIQRHLAMMAKKEMDRQKLIAASEWLGNEMEEEIDRTRRNQQQTPRTG